MKEPGKCRALKEKTRVEQSVTKIADWCQWAQQPTSGLWVQALGDEYHLPVSQVLKDVVPIPTWKQGQWFVACVDFTSLTKA